MIEKIRFFVVKNSKHLMVPLVLSVACLLIMFLDLCLPTVQGPCDNGFLKVLSSIGFWGMFFAVLIISLAFLATPVLLLIILLTKRNNTLIIIAVSTWLIATTAVACRKSSMSENPAS